MGTDTLASTLFSSNAASVSAGKNVKERGKGEVLKVLT
jgi:hypothetical protein